MIADFQLPIADLLECPTNFSLSIVDLQALCRPEYLVGTGDKLKFVGHSSKSAIGNRKSAISEVFPSFRSQFPHACAL